MIKKRYIFLGFIIVIIFLITGPLIINWLMIVQQNKVDVKGTVDVWIASLSTYFGAIIGGVVSGLLTLFGVKLSLNNSNDELNKTIKEQQKSRDDELKYNSIKEQFYKLYHPLDAMINSFAFEHGAHAFSDLKEEQKNYFMNHIIKNDIFAEPELYIKLLSIRFAANDKDFVEVDRIYEDIINMVEDTLYNMKKVLGFPNYFD